MRMREKWASVLRDPDSGEVLELIAQEKDGDDILGGRFRSRSGKVWPIINGVPRFVPETFYGEKNQTVESFSTKWTTWENKAGRLLGQTPQERADLSEQLGHLFGLQSGEEVERMIFKSGARILDAGCGIGWAEELFNNNQDCERFALDISQSVEVARARTRMRPNVCVLHGDILHLPFDGPTFDAIFSSGVVHHTGDAHQAFSKLAGLLKPGGIIGIYIYAVKPLVREMSDIEIRKSTVKMTYQEAYEFSDQISRLGRAFSKIKTSVVIEKDIPLLGIKKGEYKLQKFMYDHLIRCWWNDKLDLEFANLQNVDWFHPTFASHHTREEILQWFSESGLTINKFLQPKGWETSGFFVSGRRPL